MKLKLVAIFDLWQILLSGLQKFSFKIDLLTWKFGISMSRNQNGGNVLLIQAKGQTANPLRALLVSEFDMIGNDMICLDGIG